MTKAKTKTKKQPQLSNWPIGRLVDELGELKVNIAEMEKRQKLLREEFLAREVRHAYGDAFSATVSHQTRAILDTKAVKEEMGTDWWLARCRESEATVVTVEAL